MTGLRRRGNLVAITAALLAVASLLLWSGGDGPENANAYPGLTVGIDANPTTNTDANSDGVFESVDLTKLESCRDVTNGTQFTMTVFVLDGLDLIGFDADLQYNGSVVNLIGSQTKLLFLDAPPGSTVSNFSQNVPQATGTYAGILQENEIDDDADTLLDEDPVNGVNDDGDGQTDEDAGVDKDGFYETAGADTANVGADGSGTLALLTFKAVANGVSTTQLNLNPGATRGVTLTNTAGAHPGDTIVPLDGLYDGPFLNSSTTVAVGQPDLDGDGKSDICDTDDDGDGVPDASDNCPRNANAGQQDMDSDGLGDTCDTDADGDGYHTEAPRGADDLSTSSTPERCDGIDNDGDAATDEGWGSPATAFPDVDADTIPDCTDSNVDTDGDGSNNNVDTDDDGDGFTDTRENFMSTVSVSDCPITTSHHAWPPDLNNNRSINVLDVGVLRPVFLTQFGVDPAYNKRMDLNADNTINILDIGALRPYFLASCVP